MGVKTAVPVGLKRKSGCSWRREDCDEGAVVDPYNQHLEFQIWQFCLFCSLLLFPGEKISFWFFCNNMASRKAWTPSSRTRWYLGALQNVPETNKPHFFFSIESINSRACESTPETPLGTMPLHARRLFWVSEALIFSMCVRGLGLHNRILQFGNSLGEREIITLLLFNHGQALKWLNRVFRNLMNYAVSRQDTVITHFLKGIQGYSYYCLSTTYFP